jgi:DNA repair exonuclease SbcCD ATPase subunit
MTALEDQMKLREKEMAEKARSLKEQLRRLDVSSQKDGDGPAKDLKEALAKGDLNKAKEEIERLNKRLQNHELTEKEQEQLRRQLQDMKEKLQRLAEAKNKEQQLKAANLDPATLKKELQKEKQRLGDLNKLAEQLGKCEKCLKEGDMDAASKSLGELAKKLDGMDLENQELQDLRDQLARLQDAKDSC